MTTEYSKSNARKALPYLIDYAKKQKTVTYKELGKDIGKHHRAVPHLLGYIRDEICTHNGLPLLNVIVVNASTRIPGDSFIKHGTKGWSESRKRTKFEELLSEVFTYDKWDNLLKELNLEPIKDLE